MKQDHAKLLAVFAAPNHALTESKSTESNYVTNVSSVDAIGELEINGYSVNINGVKFVVSKAEFMKTVTGNKFNNKMLSMLKYSSISKELFLQVTQKGSLTEGVALNESLILSTFAKDVIAELTAAGMYDEDGVTVTKSTRTVFAFEDNEIDEVVTFTEHSNGVKVKVVVDGDVYINKMFNSVKDYTKHIKG